LPTFRLVGPGRAGRSLARALRGARWVERQRVGRGDDATSAAAGVDVLVISTPDAAIGRVAALVDPVPTTLVVHLSGSLGPEVLAPHERRAAMHPLVTLPDEATGGSRLSSGVTFAVSGDPDVTLVVDALGGRALTVDDADRATYHAAACIASNHLVALLGHLERVAQGSGVPVEAFLSLARCAFDDVSARGPQSALTGPVSRGDWGTVARHRQAIGREELPTYDAMVEAARRLVSGQTEGEAVPCAS
jgi:predicted short-subunit dehydrogenase-like oxidoreductase (DUF2520 family)